jgi:hypothetical protein
LARRVEWNTLHESALAHTLKRLGFYARGTDRGERDDACASFTANPIDRAEARSD